MKKLALTTICLLALAACDKPATPDVKPDDPSAKNAAASGTTAAAAPAAPVAIADGDLATPADFEAAAEQSITKKNYKNELATLEADISKE